jgi:hypothetical protein
MMMPLTMALAVGVVVAGALDAFWRARSKR